MSELIIPDRNEVFEASLSSGLGYDGWHFTAGDPEYWRFHDTLVKPGGTVLDIGIGQGRSSMYFALNGMKVVGYDTNPQNVDRVNEMAETMRPFVPFDMSAHYAEASRDNIPSEEFDSVILAYMHHMPSKDAMFDLMDLAFGAVKPGGAMWFRAVGKSASSYQELLENSEYYPDDIFVVDEDVIMHTCNCSGEYKIEPSVFLEPLEVFKFFADRDAKLVHTQTLPQTGRWNMMFGEDFRQDTVVEQGGMISILAAKPIPA